MDTTAQQFLAMVAQGLSLFGMYAAITAFIVLMLIFAILDRLSNK